jgi:hypothetical protein
MESISYLGGVSLFVTLWLGNLVLTWLVKRLGLEGIWISWLCQLEAAIFKAAGGSAVMNDHYLAASARQPLDLLPP